MTCQYCQTWNTDDEHRCRRCGRLLQDMPDPPAARSYPVTGASGFGAAAAAARREQDPVLGPRPNVRTGSAQPALFETVPEPRVIPFNSLTSPRERHAIQERMEGLANGRSAAAARQAEVAQPSRRRAKTEAQQSGSVPRAATARAPKPRPLIQNQQSFHFADENEPAAPPAPVISCDALAAPPVLRIQAALIDTLCMAGAAAFAFTPILIWARPFPLDRWTLGWSAVVLAAVIVSYQLMWIICGADSVGARTMRLALVGLDGTPPDATVRYKRLFAMLVSIFAAGVGLLWALFDEDRLTWHDHMSGTFPAIAEE